MPFQPAPGDSLTIGGTTYRVVADPAAPGRAWLREGQQSSLFSLRAPDGATYALKRFKLPSRGPALVAHARQIAPYATLPGLAACSRTLLTPLHHTDLLRSYPDLSYAALMPWVDGPSWGECMRNRTPLTPAQSLYFARCLALLLATMEERQLAHGNLCASNLLLPGMLDPTAATPVALVDLEQLYGPGFIQPTPPPSPDHGYAHRTGTAALWSPEADRFAGALLLAEILGWCDPTIRASASSDQFFSPGELQQQGPRYDRLCSQLRARWGEGVAQLFVRTWQSRTLQECPRLQEWWDALPTQVPTTAEPPRPSPPGAAPVRQPQPTVAVRSTPQRTWQLLSAGGVLLLLLLLVAGWLGLRTLQSSTALSNLAAQRTPTNLPLASQVTESRPTSAPSASPAATQQPTPTTLSIPRSDTPITPETASLVQLAQRLGQGKINALVANPDGSSFAVAMSTGIAFYTAQDLQLIRFIPTERSILTIAFAPDGKTLASGAEYGIIQFWRVSDGSLHTTLNQGNPIFSLAFAPDGKTLISGSAYEYHYLWRVSDGLELATIKSAVVTFAPDSQTLASKTVDNTIELLRTSDGSLITTLEGGQDLAAIAFSPDSNLLAGGFSDGRIQFWQVSDGSLRTVWKSSSVATIAFSPDGTTLATGSADGNIQFWQMSDGSLRTTLESDPVSTIVFSPDGTTLAAASAATYDERGQSTSSVGIWRVSDGKLLGTIEGVSGVIDPIVFAPDGQTLAVRSNDGYIQLWRTRDASLLTRTNLDGHYGVMLSTAFTADGQFFASGSMDSTVRIWRVSDYFLYHTLKHSDSVGSVAFAPDGQTLAAGARDGTIRIWRVDDGTLLNSIPGHRDGVTGIAFSPDGQILASGSDDNTVRLWRVRDGNLITTLAHSDPVSSIAFTPDGQTLASASLNNVWFWRVSDGSLSFRAEGDWSRVISVAFSPNGQTLASVSGIGTIQIWRVDDGALLATLAEGFEFSGRSFSQGTFTPDGQTLAVAGSIADGAEQFDRRGIIDLWRVSDGTNLTTLIGHFPVNSITFAPDGKTLASGFADGTIGLWQVPSLAQAVVPAAPTTTASQSTTMPPAATMISSVAVVPAIPTLPRTLSFIEPRLTGSDVLMLQTRLARYGYDPQGLDGIFGPRTERAVINFQAQNGLVADGVVGPKTWDKLFTPGIRLGPDAVAQSNRQSILTNGSSLVVGGFQGDRWIKNKEFGSIPGDLYFDRYSARGWIGGAINTPGTRSNGAATNCWDSMTVTLSPSAPQDSRPSVALFATFDPQPRSSEVVTEVSDELRTMVATWLAQKGMPQATIRIIQIVRADLDGDGSVEELISAAWRVSELATRASAGDYSVVLLRRANAPTPLEIIGEYYPVADDTTSSSQYAVAALLDLNGDGWLEILLSGSAFESWWMQVYVIDTNWQPNLVLAEGCGA